MALNLTQKIFKDHLVSGEMVAICVLSSAICLHPLSFVTCVPLDR